MTKIAVENAEFFWNAVPGAGRMPTQFAVADRTVRMAQFKTTGRDDFRDYRASLGAHVAGWMEGDPLQTPAAKFAQIFLTRLSPLDLIPIHDALAKFAAIEGQGWAEQMLAALDRYVVEAVPVHAGEGFDPEEVF